ncbi:MarR family winged helix-turn-helix transcriptional regulator [Kutzneria kofuensis]|uniref:DNA-binding MarR family transcriptional regulator n=1 Tax=Kutzneria kofuensis TaxID=103725 RepID=A0A7W9NFR5_9PSEU|nr:MarR family transcriptional regulator [Kutzneria kofuensis]MBB5890288.1 DNA-binding MarR family transcriptional regulator [Kutzneria kofuensis]
MADPRWLDERELTAWKQFLTVGAIINRLVDQQLKRDAGLSHPQYEVLARLADTPDGRLRMTELAGAAVTSKSGLTYQVGQLEKAGFVERQGCAGDERGIVAALTEKGRQKLREAAPGHAALVRELFVDGMSRKEFTAFAEGLGTLHHNLRDQAIQTGPKS